MKSKMKILLLLDWIMLILPAQGTVSTSGDVDPPQQELLSLESYIVSRKSGSGPTPTGLHAAVVFGLVHFIYACLRRADTDVNAADTRGNTALHLALIDNKPHVHEIAIILSAHHPDVNALNKQGYSPLDEAILSSVPMSVLRWLWEKGAHAHYHNPHNGLTPLQVAVYCENTEAVKLLLKVSSVRANIGARDYLKGHTALHLAITKGNYQMVKLLLDTAPESTNRRDKQGNTPLHLAVTIDRKMVQMVHKANPQYINARNNYGRTPLHMAVSKLDRPLLVILVLLRYGADVRLLDNRQNTVFHYAAVFATRRTLEYIAGMKNTDAVFDARNVNGATPLHVAVKYGRRWRTFEFVTNLLERGADIHTVDERGQTLLHVAVGRSYLIKLLLQTLLHVAVGRIYLIKLLLMESSTSCVNQKSNTGSTPLHLAVDTVSPTSIQALLDAGAHLNERNNAGQTPLHIAALKPSPYIVQQLLHAGANPNIGDSRGDTPFHALMRAQNRFSLPLEGNHKEVFDALAVVTHQTATNDDGDTASDVFRKATSPS